jgi:hypothetical protein
MVGFDLGGAINASADWVCGAPIIRSIVSNPVFTALLIPALAATVVMAVYHYEIKTAGSKRACRALLYVFLIVTAVVFVHHYAMSRILQETSQQSGIRDVFNSIEISRQQGVGYKGGAPADNATSDGKLFDYLAAAAPAAAAHAQAPAAPAAAALAAAPDAARGELTIVPVEVNGRFSP